ncbi:hypothetical protein MKX08_000779 [Trichoderma sp. CBMAI-0020]|nr:hypothetical protein MKX08_000779 [Trichoderma sp. CBMAI-0020]
MSCHLETQRIASGWAEAGDVLETCQRPSRRLFRASSCTGVDLAWLGHNGASTLGAGSCHDDMAMANLLAIKGFAMLHIRC